MPYGTFCNDDDLSALPPRAHDLDPQSTGLVAGEAIADLSTTSGERQAGKQRTRGDQTAEQASWQPSPVTQAAEKLTVAQIIRLGAAQYVAEYRDRGACYNVQKNHPQ